MYLPVAIVPSEPQSSVKSEAAAASTTEKVESMDVDTEGGTAAVDAESKDHLKDILEGLPDFDIKKEQDGGDEGSSSDAYKAAKGAGSTPKKTPEKDAGKRKPDPKASGGPAKKK